MHMDGFSLALKWAGGTGKALAEKLEVSPAAVTKWKHEGLPEKRALQIERLSGGELRAADLLGWKQSE